MGISRVTQSAGVIPSVLVVEVDAGLNRLICKSLPRIGIPAEGVSTGGDAISRLASKEYSLLIVDYKLPDMNGLELVEKSRGSNDAVPFVVVTGHGDQNLAVEMMKLGALDYFVKDAGFLDLLPKVVTRAVDDFLSRRRLVRTESALVKSEERFGLLWNTMNMGAMLVDSDTRTILDMNARALAILGRDRSEVVGRKCHRTVCPAEEGRCPILDEGQKFDCTERTLLDAKGRHVPVLETVARLTEGDRNLHLATFLDITDRKRTEEALRESKALVESVVENVPLMIFLEEAIDLRFVMFNRAGEELLGYDRASLLGKNNLDLFPPEQAAHFMAKDREVLDGAAGMLDIPEEPILTAKKGLRLLHTRKVCIRGEDGNTKYLLGISEDITERKRAEENRLALEAQLRQSQKMEAIGQLAGGIAHDFNNILGGIMGYADLLRLKLGDASAYAGYARKIADSADKASRLTRQLLTFARRGKVDIEPLDVHASIGRVAEMLANTIDKRIVLAMRLNAAPSIVPADAAQLENALLNLGINARDAMPEGGVLTFSTSSVTLDGSTLPGEESAAIPGAYIRIEVDDTGTGMDEETRKRVFEPFFTTKPVGKGTGLGLSAVYGFVKQHDGYLTVESSPGRGARFAVYLPSESRQTVLPAATRNIEVVRGSGLVLVVDDDEDMRASASEVVKSFGYDAVTAADGREAVEYFVAHYREVAVVLLDLNMPRMGGLECLGKLRAIDATVKVIVASGSGRDDETTAVLTHGAVFIQKPYGAADLSRALEAAFTGAHRA